jgi:endonuclease/exonuclease/phosphatase family metal-dependent hydrolase
VKLRVLTYNIHKCIGGLDRRYAPERVRDTIAHYDPDVVMLQEVDDKVKRSSHHSQVDVLGEMLGLRHRTWFPNVQVRGGGEYGNAILSKFPIHETRNIDLTIPPRKRRSVLHALCRVQLPGHAKDKDGHAKDKDGHAKDKDGHAKDKDGGHGHGHGHQPHDHSLDHSRTLHFFNMHLGLAQYERKLQLQQFLESHPFAGLAHHTPVIVAGDFNDVWGTLGRLLQPSGFSGVARPLRTFPAYAPMRALDSIYVRGSAKLTHVQRAGLALARQASDHLPLIADISLE